MTPLPASAVSSSLSKNRPHKYLTYNMVAFFLSKAMQKALSSVLFGVALAEKADLGNTE